MKTIAVLFVMILFSSCSLFYSPQKSCVSRKQRNANYNMLHSHEKKAMSLRKQKKSSRCEMFGNKKNSMGIY